MFFTLAVGVGLVVSFILAHRSGVLTRDYALAIIVVAAATLVGAKLYGSIERGGEFAPLSAELFAGYRAPGAVLGAALALSLLQRFLAVRPWAVADILAPGAAFGMAVFRIGCLLAGCCVGSVCELPWAIRLPRETLLWHKHVGEGLLPSTAGASLPVHPFALYLGGWSMIVGLAVSLYLRSKPKEGQVFLAYIALAGLGKFVIENYRSTNLPHIQYAALASGLIGAALFLYRRPVIH